MRCHRVQRLLPDYIADELSTAKRERVEQHLEKCPACRAELAALQGVWDGLAHQLLPQKGEAFWGEFSRGVMAGIKKKRLIPAEKKTPLLLPGWRVLLPAAGAAAAVIVAVIILKGGLGPGPGQWSAQDGQEALVEVAQPFSVAPLAGEEEDPFGRGMSLNGLSRAAEGPGIGLKPAEKAVLTEALTQLTGDEDLSGQLEELDEGELEEFEQLLSAGYPLT
ncbi:MAG: zf-HC2 domain-containing protein [Desulfobacterales bacterium]|nr:zf-HC2 domain-containing protein [Desulfobacterales bacterium]